jgi:hypothetical protein
MKTYEDFRAEVMERDFETPVSHAQIEELAAKEYAKQWVEKVIRDIVDVPPNTTVDYYLNEINKQ